MQPYIIIWIILWQGFWWEILPINWILLETWDFMLLETWDKFLLE